MDRDRNLLFGVLAVQLRKATPQQIMEAAGAWAADPSRGLPERLVAAGHVSDEDRRLLAELVEQAVRASGGDSAKALASLGGREAVERSFGASVRFTPKGDVVPGNSAADAVWSLSAVDEFPGRYTEGSLHSQGGMGRILVVHDRHLGRDIALKELLSDRAPDSPLRVSTPDLMRFVREARITGQLEHPSVIPIYEVGRRTDGSPYYTMKLVRGQTLQDAVEQAPTLRARLALLKHFVDLGNAIAYAHSRGVIHRDIKPDNVMVGAFGETVVIDWGLAKVRDQSDIHREELERTLQCLLDADGDAGATLDGQVLGTPSYMPPEQARGAIDAIDERSDVYALGAVLYKLLTGRAPFVGHSVRDILDQVLADSPTPVEDIQPDAPPELVAICRRAMRKDPAERYPSARELVEEVERFQSGALVREYEYSLLEHFRRFVRRNRVSVAMGAMACVLIAITAAYYQVRLIASYTAETDARLAAEQARALERSSREAAESARDRAERERYYASISLAKRLIDDLRFDEARRTLAECPETYRHWEWGYLNGLCRTGLFEFVGGDAPIHAVAVSANGALLATGGEDGVVRVWDPAAGERRSELTGHDGAVLAAAVSADGTRLLTGCADGTGRVWDLEQGTSGPILREHAGAVNAVAIHPDGSRAATGGSDGTIRLWSLETGKTLATLRGHVNDVTSLEFSPDGTRLASGSRDNTVWLWNVETGARVWTARDHLNDVTAVSFSPDGDVLASGSLDETVRLWRASDGAALSRLKETAGVTACAFSKDGVRLAVANVRGTVTVRDAATGDEVTSIRGHGAAVSSVAFLPDGRRLVTGSEDGKATLWDMRNSDGVLRLGAPEGVDTAIKFAGLPGGARVAAAGNPGVVAVWDTLADRLINAFETGPVVAMEISPDGTDLMTLGADTGVRLWCVETGEKQREFTQPGLQTAAYGPNNRWIALGFSDGRVELASTGPGETVVRLEGHNAAVMALEFTADGRLLATGDASGQLRVWRLPGGEAVTVFGIRGAIYDAAFWPDGTRIVSAGDSNVVWDLHTGSEVLRLGEDLGRMVAVDVSPDGKRFVLGSAEGRVVLFDGETGHELLVLDGAPGYVRALAFGDGAETLLATLEGRDGAGMLALWRVGEARDQRWDGFEAYLRQTYGAGKSVVHGEGELLDRPVPAAQFDAMLRVASTILRQNRDHRGYRGRAFVSGGLYVDESGDMESFRILGIQVGDLITHINEITLDSYDAAIEALELAALEGRREILVRLTRRGEPLGLRFYVPESP